MEKTNIKKRQSNLELLRIISMILIIMHHYGLQNFGFGQMVTINRIIVQILQIRRKNRG